MSKRLFYREKYRELYVRFLWLRLLPTLTRPGEQPLDPAAVQRAAKELVELVKSESTDGVRAAVGRTRDWIAAYEQLYGLGAATCRTMIRYPQ